MFDFIRIYCPELFNARVIHKFQKTTVIDRKMHEHLAVKVWFDGKCETYVFASFYDYDDMIEELSQLCEEEIRA